MGKKKRNHPDVEEILSRPWCYYCERDFDDLKILINHQRAKHFMCDRCGRRLNTAGGLSVHLNQVHKETLSQIENALPNRSGLEVEIFGMEGIPEDVVQQHQQRVLGQYAEAEAARRAVTGNPAPGGAGAGGGSSAAKKPKFESPSEMKQRLAEHKAKKAAEEAASAAAAANGGVVQHTEGNGTQSPAFVQQPVYNGTSPFPGQQLPYAIPPGNGMYGNPPQPYGQPTPQYPVQQPPSFQAPPQGFNGQPQPQAFNGQPPPFAQPTFSPQPYPAAGFQPPPFQNSPPPFPGAPARPFGSNTPPGPYRVNTPPQGTQPVQRQNSLPTAPGLPQRPSFNAPNVPAAQMQQMHHGQHANSPNTPFNPQAQETTTPPQNGASVPPSQPPQTQVESGTANGQGKLPTKPEAPPKEAKEKKSKKDKDNIKLVYSDNEMSPEEKMSKLARYAFDPSQNETILGDPAPPVVKPVDDGFMEG